MIKLTDEEKEFLKGNINLAITEETDINDILSELDWLITTKGLTKDQQLLNEFGMYAQQMYDHIYDSN